MYETIELIDTLWNVNVLDISLKNLHALELIDTLWNVNFKISEQSGTKIEN